MGGPLSGTGRILARIFVLPYLVHRLDLDQF